MRFNIRALRYAVQLRRSFTLVAEERHLIDTKPGASELPAKRALLHWLNNARSFRLLLLLTYL